MSTFTIGLYSYQSRPMSVLLQLAVVRRLLPLIPVVMGARRADGNIDPVEMASAVVGPLSEMKDEDVNFILSTVLSHVQRQKSGDTGFMNIWNTQASAPQFDDIDLATMVQITWEVIQGDFAPFLNGSH